MARRTSHDADWYIGPQDDTDPGEAARTREAKREWTSERGCGVAEEATTANHSDPLDDHFARPSGRALIIHSVVDHVDGFLLGLHGARCCGICRWYNR